MVIESPYGPLPPLPPTNVYNLLFNRPDQDGWSDFTAQIDAFSGERRSFQTLRTRMRDLLTAISIPLSEGGLGLLPGGETSQQMVGIFSTNSLDYPVVTNALLANTTPFALISSFSTDFELKHALTLSRATHMFIDAKLLPKASVICKKSDIPTQNIIVMNGSVNGYTSVTRLLETVRKRKLEQRAPQAATRDTLAYLVFSSGTSGLPKAVMISHGNLIASIMQTIRHSEEVGKVHQPPPPQTPEGIPVVLAALPFHHTFGLHMFCLRSGLTPMTVAILPRWNTEAALKAIPKYRVTALLLVPSMWHQLTTHRSVINGEVDLSSVLTMAAGAAYVSPSLAAKLKDLKASPEGPSLSQGYGLSECTISATGTGVEGFLGGKKFVPTSTGYLAAGMQAKVLREDGTEASEGEPGELYLKGPNIALGYWHDEIANSEAFLPDGWLRTGDRFRVESDGAFYFCDRAKDTLKISGAQVSPSEIEDVLLAHPDKLIVDAAVAGVSGGRGTDEKVPRAWVVLSPAGHKIGSKDVITILDAWHKEQLSKYKWLRGGITVVKEIPKLPTGKVLRRELVERHEKSRTRSAKL